MVAHLGAWSWALVAVNLVGALHASSGNSERGDAHNTLVRSRRGNACHIEHLSSECAPLQVLYVALCFKLRVLQPRRWLVLAHGPRLGIAVAHRVCIQVLVCVGVPSSRVFQEGQC